MHFPFKIRALQQLDVHVYMYTYVAQQKKRENLR